MGRENAYVEFKFRGRCYVVRRLRQTEAVQKDRNRRAKRDLTQRIAEKYIDFQSSAALLVFAHYLCGKNIGLFRQPLTLISLIPNSFWLWQG